MPLPKVTRSYNSNILLCNGFNQNNKSQHTPHRVIYTPNIRNNLYTFIKNYIQFFYLKDVNLNSKGNKYNFAVGIFRSLANVKSN